MGRVSNDTENKVNKNKVNQPGGRIDLTVWLKDEIVWFIFTQQRRGQMEERLEMKGKEKELKTTTRYVGMQTEDWTRTDSSSVDTVCVDCCLKMTMTSYCYFTLTRRNASIDFLFIPLHAKSTASTIGQSSNSSTVPAPNPTLYPPGTSCRLYCTVASVLCTLKPLVALFSINENESIKPH